MRSLQGINIPEGQYTRRSFQEYMVKNPTKLFPHSKKRKWIKVHGVRTYEDEWESKLKPFLKRKLGEVWQVSVPLESRGGRRYAVDFFVAKYTPRLLLFYTASTSWEYERTLNKLIATTPGLGQMWIGPKMFEDMVLHFVDVFNPVVEEFRASRFENETLPARIRPKTRRQVHWTASDSLETLKELKELYGVRPYSVTMKLRKGDVQLTDEGLVVVTRINNEMFDALDEALGFVKEEETRITQASQGMKFEIEKETAPKGTIAIPSMVSGTILLAEPNLNSAVVGRIKARSKFEFIDSTEVEGSFRWVATVKDKGKKSVFGLSADEKTIRLLPRIDATFESFLGFYKEVLDEADPNASLKSLGNSLGR